MVTWEELTNVRGTQLSIAWCLCGDFNAVKNDNEKKDISTKSNQKKEIRGFNSFRERNFLVELPVVGKKYTWYKADGSAKSRLDRVLVSDE